MSLPCSDNFIYIDSMWDIIRESPSKYFLQQVH